MADALLTATMVVSLAVIAIVAWVVYSTWRKGREGRLSPTNYRAFFIMGLVWFVVGSALMAASTALGMPIFFAFPLFALGAIYLIIGLINKDKWNA